MKKAGLLSGSLVSVLLVRAKFYSLFFLLHKINFFLICKFNQKDFPTAATARLFPSVRQQAHSLYMSHTEKWK